MCVAIMYTRENEGEVKDACTAFLDIAAGGGATVQEWFVLKLMILRLQKLPSLKTSRMASHKIKNLLTPRKQRWMLPFLE